MNLQSTENVLQRDGRAAEVETLLTFNLADQTFGISVELVSEIIDPQITTRVPNANALAPTLINVRGSIVPVFDLRHRLGMKPAEQIHSSRMLVIYTTLDGEPTKIAIIADEVEDVIEVAIDDHKTVPELGIRWPIDCFRGVTEKDDTLVILLDQSSVFPLKKSTH